MNRHLSRGRALHVAALTAVSAMVPDILAWVRPHELPPALGAHNESVRSWFDVRDGGDGAWPQ